MAEGFRPTDGRRDAGFAEGKLRERKSGAEARGTHERRDRLDLQGALDKLAARVQTLEEQDGGPLLSVRFDIDAGVVSEVPANTGTTSTISGSNLVVAHNAELPATRRIVLSDQRAGSLLSFHLAVNAPLSTEITALDPAGAPVSLATGTHSIALQVWA